MPVMHLKTLRRIMSLLVLVCFAMPISADENKPALTVESVETGIGLTPHISIYEDTSTQLTVADVSNHEFSAQFKALNSSANFGFSNSTWWVKLTLKNASEQTQKLILRQNYPLIDYVDFYQQQEDNSWLNYSTGDRQPFAQRPVDYREFLFPFSVQENTETTVFLRFESSGPINISLDLHSDISLLEQTTESQLAVGIYYGGFVILVLYNLFLFFAVKDRTFLYYLFYITSYGLYFSVHNGLAYQYFWPQNPWMANQSLIILLSLSLVWALQFSRSILSIDRVAPLASKIASGLIILSAVPLLFVPFATYKTIILPLSLITVVCTVHLMVMGFIALAAGSKPARYYLLAWSALLIGVFAYMLKSFGILPHNFWTQNGQQIGSLVEMVLLSLAIGSKVNELQRNTYVDMLTGLSNRRYFDERLSKEIDQLKNKAITQLSLLVIDIDLFKKFNDNYGHKLGDEALKTMGIILRKSARKYNIPCRYGGEEFAVILPNTSTEQATIVAERIRKEIEEDKIFPHQLTASIGVATFESGSIDSPQRLFEAADSALYTAKENGRNRVEAFKTDSSRRAA